MSEDKKLIREHILIPKAIFWTIIIAFISAILGSYVNTQQKFSTIEKEIAVLQINIEKDIKFLKFQIEKDLEILERMEKKLDNITSN